MERPVDFRSNSKKKFSITAREFKIVKIKTEPDEGFLASSILTIRKKEHERLAKLKEKKRREKEDAHPSSQGGLTIIPSSAPQVSVEIKLIRNGKVLLFSVSGYSNQVEQALKESFTAVLGSEGLKDLNFNFIDFIGKTLEIEVEPEDIDLTEIFGLLQRESSSLEDQNFRTIFRRDVIKISDGLVKDSIAELLRRDRLIENRLQEALDLRLRAKESTKKPQTDPRVRFDLNTTKSDSLQLGFIKGFEDENERINAQRAKCLKQVENFLHLYRMKTQIGAKNLSRKFDLILRGLPTASSLSFREVQSIPSIFNSVRCAESDD